MKYLLVVAIVLVAYFLWRHQRRSALRSHEDAADTAAGSDTPQAMVRCLVCALHLPETDAVPGRRGLYCSEAHRAQAEG